MLQSAFDESGRLVRACRVRVNVGKAALCLALKCKSGSFEAVLQFRVCRRLKGHKDCGNKRTRAHTSASQMARIRQPKVAQLSDVPGQPPK